MFNIRNYIKSENFLLLNGDAIFDFNLNKIYKNHVKNNKTYITFLDQTIYLTALLCYQKEQLKILREMLCLMLLKFQAKSNNMHMFIQEWPF